MSQADTENAVCTTREAAEMLGVSLRTVQLWVDDGVLQAWRTPGGHRRVSLNSVQFLLRQRDAWSSGGLPAALPASAADTEVINVLVVEDNEVLSKLYRATIMQWGLPVSVRSVKDGFEALLAIGACKPDIILTDIDMPGMDGIALLNKLREGTFGEGVEIIVVTGLDAEQLAARGGVPSGVSVFLKPAPFGLIQARMQEIANRKLLAEGRYVN